MTEFEIATSNDLKNSLMIGNQEDFRNRETTYLTNLSRIAQGVLEIDKETPRANLSEDEIRDLDSKIYDYRTTIRGYLRTAWIESEVSRSILHRQGNVLWARQKSARDDISKKLKTAGRI